MIRKFIIWFVVFFLSFFVANTLGWAEQGKAFLYIHLGINAIVIIILAIAILIAGSAYDMKSTASGLSALILLATIGVIVIDLFATWGATKLFDVDFYVAYQIMTFGQCLVVGSNSKNNN